MKRKITLKDLKNRYKNRISVGYCDLYYIMQYREPDYYYTNNYGWRFDIYIIDYNTIITTGYTQPFDATYKILQKIAEVNTKIRNILNSNKNYNIKRKEYDFYYFIFIAYLKEYFEGGYEL